MPGRVRVQSVVGQGSSFTVTLPVGKRERLVQGGTAPKGLLLQGKTLVLTEDHEPSGVFVRDFLKATGAEVLWAKDGVETLEFVEKNQVDAILMDISMPRMNGLEAMRLLRGQGRDIPILALTALASPADQEQCMAAGASAWLSKPFSLPEVLQKLRLLLGLPPSLM